MRKTLVVHNRFALRSYRTRAALTAAHGLQLLTIEQLAARLAGGFLRPIEIGYLANSSGVYSANSHQLSFVLTIQEQAWLIDRASAES